MDTVDNSFYESNSGKRVLGWLLDRGIANHVLRDAKVRWDGTHIVIPILDEAGNELFNKKRRDPERTIGPKYSYDAGAKTALYGVETLLGSERVIICEGELDALLLRSRGFTAVSSTGGAGTFKEEWAPLFANKIVYVIYDNDEAGATGAHKVCRMIPHANYTRLPPSVGEHGDVTDYFHAGKTFDDFLRLLASGQPLPPPEPEPARKKHVPRDGTKLIRAKSYPLGDLLGTKKKLGFVRCPIHNERTASFKIYPDNRWYCYGCGKGGDTVDFVMLRDGCTMPEAIQKILDLK